VETAQFWNSGIEIYREIIGLCQEQKQIIEESHNIYILYKFISLCMLNNKHVSDYIHYSCSVCDKTKSSPWLSSGHIQCLSLTSFLQFHLPKCNISLF
jgi:hypothetical protein